MTELEKNKKNEEENKVKSILILSGIILFILVVLIFFPNTVIWNIVVLLLILTLLIFVHELGHFLMGKLFGVHIYEFALGMGPKVLSFHRKNDPTTYSLRALPIGGYCQMAGEEGEDDEKLPADKFMCNKPKYQRIIILCAGVVMNFITAIILLFFISLIWGNTEQDSFVGYVEEDSPAYISGIKVGDRIVGCNGYKVGTWGKLTLVTNLKNSKEKYVYTIKHEDGSTNTYEIEPADYVQFEKNGEVKSEKITDNNTIEDIVAKYDLKEGEYSSVKLIGIGAGKEVKKGFINAVKYAFKKFGSIISTMIFIIGALFTGKLGLSTLSGPVGMYSVVGQAAVYGIASIIYLMAYLSVNLGVMNILPFPAFDGGRVLFVIIEAITRKKVNPKVEGIFHTVGFILIMLLMLYITFQDILRLF